MTSDTAQQQEPSMEEILASIRKIISEDGDGENENKDVVELTQPVPEPDTTPEIPHTETPQPQNPTLPEMPHPLQEMAVEEIQTPPPPPPPPPPQDFPPVPDQDALVNDEAIDKAADAFGRLQNNEHKLAAQLENSAMPPLPDIGHMTVEDLVRQTLKPILKDWLDANLAPMVEEHIQREIKRIRSSNS